MRRRLCEEPTPRDMESRTRTCDSLGTGTPAHAQVTPAQVSDPPKDRLLVQTEGGHSGRPGSIIFKELGPTLS